MQRDFTKYFFNDEELAKNRYIYAVIKNYVEENPTITLEEFPKKVIERSFDNRKNDFETWKTYNEVIDQHLKKGSKRYFVTNRGGNYLKDKDMVLKLADAEICISNQWGLQHATLYKITWIKRELEHDNKCLRFLKETYVTRNFQKISGKRWELYVITRVIHLLNDPDIEYVCQQYINPPKNKEYYLADLAFPSLKLYLEIDEGQHGGKNHQFADIKRDAEILEATDWECKRIEVYIMENGIKKDKDLIRL